MDKPIPAARGFSLIELLVVVAIVATLVSLLSPVLYRARQKSGEARCMSNQRALAAAILIYAQDHDEVLPSEHAVWGEMQLGLEVTRCPQAGRHIRNAYAYNTSVADQPLGDLGDEHRVFLTADGKPYGNNLAYATGDLVERHGTNLIASFADGHVELRAATGLFTSVGGGKPYFKPGHTLPPLTRWAWPLSYELNKELAEDWGYALDIDPGPTGALMADPTSLPARLAALAVSNPQRYPVSMNTRRVMFDADASAALLSEDAWCHDAGGNRIKYGNFWRSKPYLSDADAQAVGDSEVERIQRVLASGAKITLMLNGAEYDPCVPGTNSGIWRDDPAVDAWLDALPADWTPAISGNKAKQEQAVRDACIATAGSSPSGDPIEVIYYQTGDTQSGVAPESSRSMWAYSYTYLEHGGTRPSFQFYYWMDGFWSATTGQKNPLTLATNCAAQGIAGGQPLSYNWVSGGWSQTKSTNVSDDEHYMGFLKCLYTLGSIGNTAGYFSYPNGGFVGKVGANAPDWLRQIMILSHVHALFSHLEDHLRHGSLLPGDGTHVFTANGSKPAYEFDNTAGDPDLRVVIRKHDSKSEWLACAWATAGPDRDATVSVPGLGSVTLRARASGAVYLIHPGPVALLQDPDGMDPTSAFRTAAGVP